MSTLTVDPSVTEVAPELAFVPQEVRIAVPDLAAVGTVRFRITDADQDLPIDGVTVTNTSIDPEVTVHAFYAQEQIDPEGDWGWFVADVPMKAVLGSAAFDNELRIQATDLAGHELDELVTVTREGPLVWAEIAEPDPAEAEPNQLLTFDGTNSVVPGLDEPGAGMARWFFFWRVSGEWRPYRDPGFANGTSGLIQTVAMPRDYELKARLIVVASYFDFPTNPWDETLACGWDEGDGRCDFDEVTVGMANGGCVTSYTPLSVIVDSPAEDMRGESRQRPSTLQPMQTRPFRRSPTAGSFTTRRTPIFNGPSATPRARSLCGRPRMPRSAPRRKNSVWLRVTILRRSKPGIRRMAVITRSGSGYLGSPFRSRFASITPLVVLHPVRSSKARGSGSIRVPGKKDRRAMSLSTMSSVTARHRWSIQGLFSRVVLSRFCLTCSTCMQRKRRGS